MAFCSKCGAQVEGNERFCVKCGNDLTAKAAAVPAGPPVGAPPPAAPAPMPFVAPGQVPMSVAIPPQAPAKKSGMMWLAIIVVAAGGYYYYTHHVQPQGPQPANPPATQPGPAPQPGTPGGTPGPAAPVQPGDPGPGGPNDALVQQQAFNGQWRVANGYVQIYNARWMNRSNATMQSATLECDQYAQNGEVLSQQRITLNGTNPPGGTWTTNNNSPFNMGQAMQGLSNVNCGIVAVTPAQ